MGPVRGGFGTIWLGPRGTVILARIGTPEPLRGEGFRWGGVNVPLAGAGESGDDWAVAAGRGLAAMVVDGLGHGPGAACRWVADTGGDQR